LVTDYFGVNIHITHPLLTHAAFLSSLVRLEAAGAEMLILLDGYGGPIGNDLAEQARPTTLFADWGPGYDSQRYEHDWMRLLICFSPWTHPMIRRRVFTPGMLTGTWVGRLFVGLFSKEYYRRIHSSCVKIPQEQLDNILTPQPLADASPPHVRIYPRAMQFHLR
jgi:hypothetical protein